MSVMSPGFDIRWRFWPNVSCSTGLRFAFVLLSCFLFCVLGRPSEQLNYNYNHYSLPYLVPQYSQFVSYAHPVPFPVYQPISTYSFPYPGYTYNNGGQHQIFHPRPYQPPLQYRGIEPVPYSKFQHVETRSLPEQLASIQTFRYMSPKPDSRQVGSKIRTTAAIAKSTNSTKNPRRQKAGRRLNHSHQTHIASPVNLSRQIAAKKQNAITPPTSTAKYVEDSEELVQTAAKPVQLIVDNENSDEASHEPELHKNLDDMRTVEIIAKSRSKSKEILRNKRFLVVLASILARERRRFSPSQKTTRQVTPSPISDDEFLNPDLPPIPTIEDEPEEFTEMMEFGEPAGDVSKAAAMKYGMSMMAITLPAPEPSTPSTTERYQKAASSPDIKPEDVDYEVPDDSSESQKLLGNLPSIPTNTPVMPADSVATTTSKSVVTDNTNLTTSDGEMTPVNDESDLGDLPPLPAIDNEDSILPSTTPRTSSPIPSTTTDSNTEDTDEDLNDLPPLPALDTEKGVVAPTTTSTSSIPDVADSEEDELSDLPPVPSVDPVVSSLTSTTPGSQVSTAPSSNGTLETDDDLTDLPPLPAIDTENSTTDSNSFQPKPIIKPADKSTDSSGSPQTSSSSPSGSVPRVTDGKPSEASSNPFPVETEPALGPSIYEQLNSDLPPLPGSFFNTEPRPTLDPEIVDPSNESFEPGSDLPPLPDISLFPGTAEQDEPVRPRPIPTTSTSTSTTSKPPSFNDEIPPFPVTDDESLPELPFPSSLPEDGDEDLPPSQQIPDPVVPEPPRRSTTARPRPRLPTTRPRVSSVRPTAPLQSSTDVQVEIEQDAGVPVGNNDWLRDVALKALDRGISFQQVYSINVGHIVVNSGGTLSERQSSVTSKPFYQLIQEQLVPAISGLVSASKQLTQRPATSQQRRPTTMQPQSFVEPEDLSEDTDPNAGLGTDFAPIPLATDGESGTGVSEEELFSPRLNATKQSPSRNRRPTQRPRKRPSAPKPTVINNRDEITESVQPQLPNLIVSDSAGANSVGPTQILPDPEPEIATVSTPKPFRPLLSDEESPRVPQNIDPRSLNVDSFPFVFPEGTGSDSGDMDYPLDFRSSLVKPIRNYRRLNTRNWDTL